MEILGPYLIWMSFKNIYEIYSKEPKVEKQLKTAKQKYHILWIKYF